MARWCARCPTKPDAAVNLRHKKCECGKSSPSFGLPGKGRNMAHWCANFPTKPDAAVDIRNKKCECVISGASLRLTGDTRNTASWCARCPIKPDTVANLGSRRCECRMNNLSAGLPREERRCAHCLSTPIASDNLQSAIRSCLERNTFELNAATVAVQRNSMTPLPSLVTGTSDTITGASASTSDPPPSLLKRCEDPSNSNHPGCIPFASIELALPHGIFYVRDGDSATDYFQPVTKRRRRGKFVE
jgi:hypothetical protein